ncbi:MAG: DUF5309 domain-containing protein [Proteobacteria bacterium]|nr:DUF5309 domain-containing protein [Pseudomonadota bacterium]
MAAPTNAVTTLVSFGNREDLEDVIHRVAPEETPFISNIGTSKAAAIYHEWQTETLRSPSATSSIALEGNDATQSAGNLTSRVGNYCQLNQDSRGVSGTQEAVDKAGRKSELNRQKILLGLELKRDLEMRLIGNFASVAESGGTTRKSAGLLGWLTSNTSRGAGGANGGFSAGVVSAATNGTQRSFTESLVRTVLSSCFTNGGRPSQAYMGPAHKQLFSQFTGIANIRKEVTGAKMATIVGAADVYVSDFGNLTLIPHPYGLTRDCALVDPDMAAVGTLRGWSTDPLAKTGDSEKFQITAEKTLVMRNEKAHGVVADLT